MQLTIDGNLHTFIPLPSFRSQRGLPDEFALAYFEPKDWQGLGRLDSSGQALARVRQRVIEAVPAAIILPDLIPQTQALTRRFQLELMAINSQIGLREVEIEFAVAGFADVMQSVAYRLVQLSHIYRHDPSQIQLHFNFAEVYQRWLDDSARLSAAVHSYTHQLTEYKVQVVYNVYGRVGLKVEVTGEVYYVADLALACPASNTMRDLCGAVTQVLGNALTGSTFNVERSTPRSGSTSAGADR